MKKAFMGGRLKRLREERGLTQIALARALDLSPSYLNQLEKNQRPLTVQVLLKINAVFDVDVQLFAEDDESGQIADLREVLADPALTERVTPGEIRDLVANMPAIGRALVAFHRRYRNVAEQAQAMMAGLGLGDGETPGLAPVLPYEQVRDFFFAHHNHFLELDLAAENLFASAGLLVGDVAAGLTNYLARRHDIRVAFDRSDAGNTPQRLFRPADRILQLSAQLTPGQRAFQMAVQIALIEMAEAIERLAQSAAAGSTEARALTRIGLANHFAGALLMPYTIFLEAAEAVYYDVDRLADRFGVGFETVCHRLSTMQRPGASGLPFFFIRVDRAGNISKRQSATDFHFSKVGGTCPLWNVYEAFAQPGRILTQLARMPDGRTYLWVARTVTHRMAGYGMPGKTFAVALGCDLRHADRLVYSKGLDLTDPEAATPIGLGCKVCERHNCPQRAFPAIGRPLVIDEKRRDFAPYLADDR
ncbi:XRE family transcriptional regulator [Labrys miyagiensis]|uniref:XRE family transcriptional regulator n=1 Tax=Labrys miyagiensis TaxID=346912 RepID=A0ABQ6CTR7_9HYPH|nr:short-chain fatty acyl-CoA regulator family protein [Labrys miyagiensis]GLS22957.1 XRE family transcriptional regulator [Labrys miyagiensis]